MNTAQPRKIGSYVILAISLVIAFLIWNNHLLAGTRPTNIGIDRGKLAVCPATPNCVNSQAPSSDSEHAIAPIKFGGADSAIMDNLKLVVKQMPRASTVKETNNYLNAEFTSKLMGFIDDVEFYIDDASKLIQVRSASRLGESDLGVNRQRIEEIRLKLSGLN